MRTSNEPAGLPAEAGLLSHLFVSFIGLLAAGLLLIGDWSPVQGEETGFILQIRVWALALLIFFAVLGRLGGREGVFRGDTNPDERRMVRGIFLFLAYSLATVIWTPDFYGSLGKAVDVAMMILALACFRHFSLAFGRGNFNEAFWKNILFLGTILLFITLSSDLLIGKRRINALGGGPIAFSRIMGILCVAALFFILVRKRKWGYVIFCLGTVFIVLSGSRGSLLAETVGIVAFLFLSGFKWRKKILIVLLSGGLLAVILDRTPLGNNAMEMFQRRIVKLTFVRGHDAGRIEIYENAIEISRESPVFGHGLDSFKTRSYKDYPHNIFLEIFVESFRFVSKKLMKCSP